MDLNYKEKGQYLRGLLILIGKDNIINQNESKKVIEIGQKVGFSKSFCQEAVADFLENPFISTDPPVFSNIQIAEKFLEDAITLSIIDDDFHIEELEWLEKVALTNGIDSGMLDDKIKKHVSGYDRNQEADLTDEQKNN